MTVQVTSTSDAQSGEKIDVTPDADISLDTWRKLFEEHMLII